MKVLFCTSFPWGVEKKKKGKTNNILIKVLCLSKKKIIIKTEEVVLKVISRQFLFYDSC